MDNFKTEPLGSYNYTIQFDNREVRFLHYIASPPQKRAHFHKAIINYVKLNEIDVVTCNLDQIDAPRLFEQIKKINPKIKNIVQISFSDKSSGMQDCDNCNITGGKCCVDESLSIQEHFEDKFCDSDDEREIFTTKKTIDKFLSVGVDGFINHRFIPSFVNSLLDNVPKIYIISAPSGYGKSTLIDRLRYLGVRQLPKIVTRDPRPDEQLDRSVEFVSSEYYKKLLKNEEIIGHTKSNEGFYGTRRQLLEKVFSGYRNHVTDRNFEAARKMQSEYPFKVKLVALFPSSGFAGFGLEERIKKLKMPAEGFASFIEELEFLKKSRHTLQDSKDRLASIIKEAKEFEKNLPYFDIVLDKHVIEENEALLLEKMAEG